MRQPESSAETDTPLLQSNLVRVGQHDLPLLGPEDDALLVPHLQHSQELIVGNPNICKVSIVPALSGRNVDFAPVCPVMLMDRK